MTLDEFVFLNFSTNISNVNVLRISSPVGFQINTTVLDLSYQGLYSSLCKYGGFAFYTKTNEHYGEILSSCDPHAFYQKSFYSTNSTLLVILNSYKPFADINVSLIISGTHCKPVFIGVCKYTHYCHQSDSKCTTLFGQVAQPPQKEVQFQTRITKKYKTIFI